VACWSTKAAISLKGVKIEEKLLWRAYRKSPTLFRTSPTPYGLLFPRLGFTTPTQNFIRYYLKNGKAKDFKFGWYIHRVLPNKSPLTILEKRERGRIQGLPKFFLIPPTISETGKTTNFKFCTHIHRIDRNKSPLKFREKQP